MEEKFTALFKKLEVNGKVYYKCNFVVPEFVPNERFDKLQNRFSSSKTDFYITETEDKMNKVGIKPNVIFYEDKGLHVVNDKEELSFITSKFDDLIQPKKENVNEKSREGLITNYVNRIYGDTKCHKNAIKEIVQTILLNNDIDESRLTSRDKYLSHDNIVLFGPIGCGKSAVLESLKKNLDIPTVAIELSSDLEVNRELIAEAIQNSEKEFNGHAVVIAELDFNKFNSEEDGEPFYPLKDISNCSNLYYSPYLKKPINFRNITFITSVNVAGEMLEYGDLKGYFTHMSGCTKAVEARKLSMTQIRNVLFEGAFSKIKFCEELAKKYNKELVVNKKALALAVKYNELFNGNLLSIETAIIESFKMQIKNSAKKIMIGEEVLMILKELLESEKENGWIEKAPENTITAPDEIIDEEEEEVQEEKLVDAVTKQITKTIRAQDKQVRRIVKIILKNMQYANDANVKNPEKRKKNILIRGESGTGKTEIIRRLAETINVPMFIADATQYTEEGYVGDSVNNMLLDLLRNANGDKEKAERGILVIDEIDKKADGGLRSDVSRGAVLHSLLKIIEGTVKKLTYEKNLPNGMQVRERIDFDTSRLSVICLGAFEDLEKFRDERVKRANKPKVVGFSKDDENKDEVPVNKNFINEDYQAFGMGNQFINRLDSKIYLNKLSKENLIDIMKNSVLSALKLKQEDMRLDGVELEYTEDFYDKLGEIAVSKKAGARGINEALEDIFESLGLNDIDESLYSKIILNGACIDDPSALILIERNAKKLIKK